MKIDIRIVAAVLIAFAAGVYATEVNNGTSKRYSGTGVNTGDVLFTALNTLEWDACNFTTTAGAATVEVTLDGVNWSAALAFEDYHSTDPATEHVAVTAATKIYGIAGKFTGVRMKQSGATAATAAMNCWSQGQSRTTTPGGV